MANSLKRPSERLIPRLRSCHTNNDIFAIANVQIELSEELLLGQGIGRVNAQVWVRPGRHHTWRAPYLYPSANAQTIGDPAKPAGGKVQIALQLSAFPYCISQRQARHLVRPLVCRSPLG